MELSEKPKKTIKSRLTQQLPHPRVWIGMIIILSLMLIVTLIIVVPGLWATCSINQVTQDLRNDTTAYYAADSGIAEVMWRFKYGQTPPFTPASPVNSSYNLPNTVNNMTVQVKMMKYTRIGTADCYIIKSSAPPDPNSRINIFVEIQQDGTTTTITKYDIK